MSRNRWFLFIVFVLIMMSYLSYFKDSENNKEGENVSSTDQVSGGLDVHAGQNESDADSEVLVTFLELGSVNCIPCRQMQPVMKRIEEEFSGQVKVVFHDVWTVAGRPYAETYRIRVIPTQVFLDKNGKEFFRHQGFFPYEEIVNILTQQGVTKS